MESPPTVLTMCYNKRNLDLLVQALERWGYQAYPASTLEALDRALAREERLDMALLDLTGFDARIWQRCDHMHRIGLPFLLISAGHSARMQQEGIQRGARGVLSKPLAMSELASLVASLSGSEKET